MPNAKSDLAEKPPECTQAMIDRARQTLLTNRHVLSDAEIADMLETVLPLKTESTLDDRCPSTHLGMRCELKGTSHNGHFYTRTSGTVREWADEPATSSSFVELATFDKIARALYDHFHAPGDMFYHDDYHDAAHEILAILDLGVKP